MYNSIGLTVRKWGNSLGIRIPKHLAELMNVQDGTTLILTFKEEHVEMKISEEETDLTKPKGRVHTKGSGFSTPIYPPGLRGRRTLLTLTDRNFEETIKKYPVIIAVFLDYMYLDFYDKIENKLLELKELANYYSRLVWFGVARMEKNELARDKYVGNVWGEEEIRGFINGKLAFKAIRLEDIADVIKGILPGDKLKTLGTRREYSVPVRANPNNMNDILSMKQFVVAGFFPPGEKTEVKLFNELARKYQGKVIFALTTDRVLFNEKSRTFYRNPLFERFDICKDSEVIFFYRGSIVKRVSHIEKETLINILDNIVDQNLKKEEGK